MSRYSILLGVAYASTLALAETHILFSGFSSKSAIYALEFDDKAGSLALVKNNTIASSDPMWIALDAGKKSLYATSTGEFHSYSLNALDYSLTFINSISHPNDNCTNSNFVMVSTVEPYPVYGVPYTVGCPALAMNVDNSGALSDIFGNLMYNSTCGIHGMSLTGDGKFVYSAADAGKAVWTHSVDAVDGTVTELQYLAAPSDSDPRHLAVHPNGNLVYVVYEAACKLAVYSRDQATGMLTDTNTTYPLIPESFTNTSSYWADEVTILDTTTSPKYLIAATRSHDETKKGYVSEFSLDPTTGAIAQQLFLSETTGSGGNANSVSVAAFDDSYFAITDSGDDFVEVWRINGTSAAPVAHLDLDGQPAPL
ncbi:carboxy-muconate cyclase [Colletotrichum camelliae]|nr:carboxy-muconate cyclase [Colletotrichum camelliae]